MNAFMEPLCDENGWTRMGVNFSLGLSAFMGQLAMPLAAAISTRVSLRLLMTLGAISGGVATCLMGLTSNLHLFTLFFIIVWVSSQFCGGVVANALMSNWFSHYRGIALGIANSGTSLSGMFLPLLALAIITNFSLKSAFLVLGITTCFLAPLCWHIVRRDPHILHLHADGRRHDPVKSSHVPVNTTLDALVRRPAVWYIGIAFGLSLMCASGILSQLKPRFSDAGITPYTAMLLASVSATFGTLAKYLWGFVCDRLSPIIAARLLITICLGSIGLLWLPASMWSLTAFGVCFATGSGGLWVVLPAVVAGYFGSDNFLGVYKLVSVFILLRCLGFPIMGISHEYFSNYFLADIIFAAALGLALFLTVLLKPERAIEKKPFLSKSRPHR